MNYQNIKVSCEYCKKKLVGVNEVLQHKCNNTLDNTMIGYNNAYTSNKKSKVKYSNPDL